MCGIVKVCVHTYLLIYLLFWKISQQQAVCHTSTFFWSMGIQWGFVLFAQEQAARYSLSKSLSQKFFWSIVKKLWTFASMLLLIRKVYYCGFYMYSMCTIYKALVTPHTATNYDLKSCYISKKKSKRSDLVKGFFLKLALKLKCMNSNFL